MCYELIYGLGHAHIKGTLPHTLSTQEGARKPGLYCDRYRFQDMILLLWLVNSFAINLLNLLVAFCAAYAEYIAPH